LVKPGRHPACAINVPGSSVFSFTPRKLMLPVRRSTRALHRLLPDGLESLLREQQAVDF